jgi:hypothetical protein
MPLLDRSGQILEISDMRRRLNLRANIRILLEYILQQEFLGQGKAFNWHIYHVNELTSAVIYNVVIAKDELVNEFSNCLELVLGGVSEIKEITNRYHSFETEIHFWDFIFVDVNDLIVGVY